MMRALGQFSEATRRWFSGAFGAPTPAQLGAWEAVGRGEHTLVVAPTGSGKTLAAFLWSLDRLATEPPADAPARRCRVLYVSPMKALAVDVDRNLRAPLRGLAREAVALGLPAPPIEVSVRTGDTPDGARRAFARRGADVLITTPESLFLLLTSKAREMLAGVEHVIVDEIHALAGSKRGAHLAVSLERLDALLPRPAQRIGLSATVRPVEEVQRFLAGGRPVTLVQPPSEKRWDLTITVPVEDLGDLGAESGRGPGGPSPRERSSIWPHVEERIVDLVAAHRSTIVFVNSRRIAERLTARMNEIWEERAGSPAATVAPPPDRDSTEGGPGHGAEGAGTSRGSLVRETAEATHNMGNSPPAVLARAHHGSVSLEQRLEIEEALKSGRLPAVVATSSLELGIDMGAVDLVIQVEAPPSVASGLQRVGRAGHHVGAVSRGTFFPAHRGDLVESVVVVRRMREGLIERLHIPAGPLDVLAQQVVAMCAMDSWQVEEALELVRRAAPFAALTPSVFESVLDMLTGRYPSDEFVELRPRLVWDREADTLTGRPGAQRLAILSGGTIPDRGLYGVFVAGEGPGRRVGELDEEMVYESRVGDVFLLGTSAWRVETITHDRVLVTPAGGQPGRLPFWRADSFGRPAELGAAVGAFLREVDGVLAGSDGSGGSSGGPVAAAGERTTAGEDLAVGDLDDSARANLLQYVREQREATGRVPSDRTLVIERFRDEMGDWQVVLHSVFGQRVNGPWALVIAARLRELLGVDVQAFPADDGIVLRLPDTDLEDARLAAALAEALQVEPGEVQGRVTDQLGGSALFAARFRECAARALLLPRHSPNRRQALWQQRLRASQLLTVASQYPSFPIVLEAVRECLQDVFDVPALEQLMADVAARRVEIVQALTPAASPFARSLLFGYMMQFVYEGDQPLAERRAAALALDPVLLAELLGTGATDLADLLDPGAVDSLEVELQGLAPERLARHTEDLADLLRRLGPISPAEAARRTRSPGEVHGWFAALRDAGRAIDVRVDGAGGRGGEARWAAVEDAGLLRDGLGTEIPGAVPPAFLDPVPGALAVLLRRFARSRGPFTTREAEAWLGLGGGVVAPALEALAGAGTLTRGRLRPGSADSGEWCDAEVMRRLRRRSLAAQRAQAEPVDAGAYTRFLHQWQALGELRGPDGLLRAVEQLAGARVPASAVESLVLPARVRDYSPALLDAALSEGLVIWQGAGTIPGNDGWVTLHLAESAEQTLRAPGPADGGPVHRTVLSELARGGAWGFRELADAVGRSWGRAGDGHEGAPGAAGPDGGRAGAVDPPLDADLVDALWDLAWAGLVTNESFGPVRTVLATGRSAHRRAPGGRLGGRVGSRPRLGSAGRIAMPSRTGPPTVAGRWSLVGEGLADPTARAVATAEVLLDRYGVVTRGAAVAGGVEGGFAAVYRVLAAAEEAGRVRRGYFVEGLGASQFASAGAVDALREETRQGEGGGSGPDAVVLAVTDPANPYGSVLPWPGSPAGRPSRSAGGIVVLVEGAPALYLERGGRTALTFGGSEAVLARTAEAVAAAVRTGRLDSVSVERADGEAVRGSAAPLVRALREAGFVPTPRGLRLRAPLG